ncbi:hypothetical protein [Blastococcus brunescens]|uniref:Glutamate/phenylalanine/leucine/valine/L-tryptophan dehydrogenase C-terminal domain-containing protein n=1 Tax=Blastococcus brunescens TaxID=1564165 RepID=A0ABZ1AXL2_9ACTN|nr:hypothetical protein [Blastococcus sp. BMG 8361]WRL63309.1 hypothetical protein U6N30_26725 [Blastococcus sp. BMG 8361]
MADTATLVRTPHDVYSPNALGGALDADTVAALPSRIVCGGANNQLATAEAAEQLRARGILYAPDYLVNAGGVIQVEDERHGFSFDRAKAKAEGIFGVALRVFAAADEEGVSPPSRPTGSRRSASARWAGWPPSVSRADVRPVDSGRAIPRRSRWTRNGRSPGGRSPASPSGATPCPSEGGTCAPRRSVS